MTARSEAAAPDVGARALGPRALLAELRRMYPNANWRIHRGRVITMRGAYNLTVRRGSCWMASTCIARTEGDGPIYVEGDGATIEEALKHLAALVAREARDGRRQDGTREDARAALVTILSIVGGLGCSAAT